ncbi:uncharacterized protein LOC100824128 [Brachypodium distachyon]|uniref:FLZ-type domain-containing protein n=1 Tax=Brachypodium distachyon TaxID=15368 RepID=I1IQC4_BRADI|nr:uncharacterized protein LOC100824128 [Brachypodium distachyon]KQJ90353.1 hypothetical protein BRADI_4g30990v3 [Brachypodium distachyon]|eukprot:XP_003578158.1 uncharacterized protein LOC100824128 [Brachypodium distachyon]
MLPRIQRSIFHLGEEGGHGHRGAEHHGHVENITHIHHQHLGGEQNYDRRRLVRRGRDATDAVVGLQILVQHQYTQPCHIVLKPMVSWPPARHRRHPRSFSRACCFLCRRVLSPTKDVYMYRGDQGFCSEECRRQQILADEARENEAMAWKDRRGLPHHRRHHHGPRPSTASVRGARLLAVA